MERGVIRNKKFALQVNNFVNLRYGNITPTDIDGLIEFRNKAYVIIEIKHANYVLSEHNGQRLAIERLTDDLQEKKPTLALIARHNENGDIDVAFCEVSEYRWKHKWIVPKERISVKIIIDWFVKKNNLFIPKIEELDTEQIAEEVDKGLQKL